MRIPAALVGFLVAGAAAAAPTITGPQDLAVPQPLFRIEGLTPGADVVLTTVRRNGDGKQALVGTARMAVPADGRLVLDTAGELAAFWQTETRAADPADPAPGLVRLGVVDPQGTQASEFAVRPDPAGLETERDTPFPGALLVKPKGVARPPVVIILGGSEGGGSTAEAFAPLFAARGYAALGLPYVAGFGPDQVEGLPRAFTEIPVDRLAEVRAWLKARRDVDGGRIGLWGVSKGAEFALLAASRYPWLKAVVAVVPSDVVWEGWGRPPPQSASFAFGGRALPFVPYADIEAEFAKIAKGGRPDLLRAHVEGRKRNPDRVAPARIPAERFRGPVLLVGGGQDPLWPSLEMAEAVAARRKAAGRQTGLVVEAEAGHGLAGPGLDPVPSGAGGTPEGNARARFAGWAETFRLLDAALQPAERADLPIRP